MTSMSDAEIDELLEQPHVAVLGTTDADGAPALAPVWYRWRDGEAIVLTQTSTRKWRNIARDARISLCVDTKEPPYRAVILEGRAEPVVEADYRALLHEIATHYLGARGGDAYMERVQSPPETSMVVRLRPERVISWAY
jgi:PPOX class probable F420-dependent enzyme